MKPLTPVLIAAVILALASAPAHAQPPLPSPLARGDVAGTIGWLSGYTGVRQSRGSNDWYNSGFYASAIAGWYWTDHHKTQIETGATNAIEFWTGRDITVNNLQTWSASNFTFQLRRLAIGQHYQFFRNQWIHPHVGAGADLTWERTTERAEPVMTYDPVTRQSIQVRPGGTYGPTTKLRVRPYLETGFKAYMSPRAFFRADTRVLAGRRLDEVVLRCGFGVDF